MPLQTTNEPALTLYGSYHSPPSVLQPVFSDPFPALPSLRSERIELQVFTHRSYFARPGHVFEDHPNDPSPDNEKFEHLGDTVLNLIVTCIIFESYPYLRVGPSTKLRSLVVGNPTLADISRRYGLPNRLRLHPAQVVTLRTSMNVQADVFESYVGGLYLDQGLSAVETWLRALFTAYIKEAYLLVRTQYGLPPLPPGATVNSTVPNVVAAPTSATITVTSHILSTLPFNLYHPPPSGVTTTTGHLALFNQIVQRDQKAVEWIYTSDAGDGTYTTPIWSVKVEVDGEEYGRGKGGTKKAARNEAAKKGLVKLGVNV
ncbi:ribonuclease III domain-containing protein [Scleroderma citrinum]